MSGSTRFAIALPIMVALLSGHLPASQSPTDEQAVRGVLEDYVVGWREGDVEKLANVFAPNGMVKWPSGSGPDAVLNTMTFEQVLARGRRPQPEYGKEWRVESLDVLDEGLAVARVYISRAGGHYIDYLTLYRIGDRWHIVSKTYVTR